MRQTAEISLGLKTALILSPLTRLPPTTLLVAAFFLLQSP